MRILLGGSPCTHWSIAQTKNRETKPEGLGWELFLNYLIALEKYQRKKVSPPLRADKPGGPKYHNQKDQREATDGRSIRFDSKKEARRFDELLVLLRAGKIVDLRL